MLVGNGGADLLNAGTGNDTVEGGSGNDSIIASDGADTFDGGADTDTLDYSGGSANSIIVVLNGSTFSTVVVNNDSNDTVRNIENVIGTAGVDSLTGDISVNVLSGGSGNDVLAGRGGNDTLDGGADTDTADYSGAAGGVTASLATQTASNDGDGGSDTLVSIENLTGSTSADTLTGSTGNNVLVGNGGADVISDGAGVDSVSAGAGNDTINWGTGADVYDGGADSDTLDYTGASGITAGSFSGTVGTITTGGETDSVSSIENFVLTSSDDLLTFDTSALASLESVDGQAGNDSMRIVDLANDLTDAGLDGADFAAIFSDVEELDFRGTDLTGGDTFDIGNDEIGAISGGSSLSIRVDSATIDLADINPLSQSGATIVGDNTVGNTRTIDWDNGTQLVINSGP